MPEQPRCVSHQGGRLRNTRCPGLGSAPWGSPSPMRIVFASWRTPSCPGGPLLKLDQVNDIHIKGLPSPQRMFFASGESPPSEWDSPARRFPPFPGGSLLQVNDIHLKGLPLSTANGIRFGGVPSSKRMVFSSRGFPLHSEWDSLQRIPLVNSEWNSHQLRNPLQGIGVRTKRVTLSKANGIRIKRVILSKATRIRTKGSPSASE